MWWLPCINETGLSCGDEINACVKCQSNWTCTHIIMYTFVYGRYYFYDRRLTMTDLKVTIRIKKTAWWRQRPEYHVRRNTTPEVFTGISEAIFRSLRCRPELCRIRIVIVYYDNNMSESEIELYFWKTYNNLIAFFFENVF